MFKCDIDTSCNECLSLEHFFPLCCSSECISHFLYIWSRIGATRLFFHSCIISVSVWEQIGVDGWWGVTPRSGSLVYFTRSTAALWRLTDPAPPWRTLSLFNNDFYALLASLAAPTTLANQLLHIWSVRCFPLFSYPDVYYPPAGVYNQEIGAWVTSRQLIGNGPWHLN